MKRPFFRSTLILVFIFLITACGTKQDIVYFQDLNTNSVNKSIETYNLIIKPDDMLTITVSALDLDVIRPFNLPAISFTQEDGSLGRAQQQTYLVDTNGNIDFPVLGKLKLAGLSRIQAQSLIKNMLKDYVKDPIVNVRNINFKITVLGEVNRPGTYTVQNERITILEALGLAGDMTIQAERKNVLVVREEADKKTYTRIDLTSESIFNSKVYYLSQNDVIYVEPNNSRVKSSTVGPNTNATLGVISTVVTVAALIISIATR